MEPAHGNKRMANIKIYSLVRKVFSKTWLVRDTHITKNKMQEEQEIQFKKKKQFLFQIKKNLGRGKKKKKKKHSCRWDVRQENERKKQAHAKIYTSEDEGLFDLKDPRSSDKVLARRLVSSKSRFAFISCVWNAFIWKKNCGKLRTHLKFLMIFAFKVWTGLRKILFFHSSRFLANIFVNVTRNYFSIWLETQNAIFFNWIFSYPCIF